MNTAAAQGAHLPTLKGTKMGEAICPIGISKFAEPTTVIHERLIGLKANVALDGSSTSFAIQYTNQHAFRVFIPLEQMPAIAAEMRYATNTMLARSRLAADRGASKLREVIHHSVNPHNAEVFIDPRTNDRLFLYQFIDQAPIALRMTAIEVEHMIGRLARKAASAYH